MSTLNLSALAAAAKVNNCELTLSQEGGTNLFTIGNEVMGYAEFSNYSEALAFLTDRKKLEAHRESDLCNRDDFGLCPVCGAEPTILNVGRVHYACCHEHRVYWPIGSNLFSAWRDEEPEVWESNKQLLATYKDRKNVPEQFEYMVYLESLSYSEVLKAKSREEFYRSIEKSKSKGKKPTVCLTTRGIQPNIENLGYVLELATINKPHGFTKIACSNGSRHDDSDFGIDVGGETACLPPDHEVTIFIRSGTSVRMARDLLKAATRELKSFDTLADFVPLVQTACDVDDLPF